ncbi:MAG: hypothetical protein AAGF71_15220 [Pseudomonadota bacterium]
MAFSLFRSVALSVALVLLIVPAVSARTFVFKGSLNAFDPLGEFQVLPLDISFSLRIDIGQDLSTEFAIEDTFANLGGTIDSFTIGTTDFDATNTYIRISNLVPDCCAFDAINVSIDQTPGNSQSTSQDGFDFTFSKEQITLEDLENGGTTLLRKRGNFGVTNAGVGGSLRGVEGGGFVTVTAPIPLPAGAPLFAAALMGLVVVRRVRATR